MCHYLTLGLGHQLIDVRHFVSSSPQTFLFYLQQVIQQLMCVLILTGLDSRFENNHNLILRLLLHLYCTTRLVFKWLHTGGPSTDLQVRTILQGVIQSTRSKTDTVETVETSVR